MGEFSQVRAGFYKRLAEENTSLAEENTSLVEENIDLGEENRRFVEENRRFVEENRRFVERNTILGEPCRKVIETSVLLLIVNPTVYETMSDSSLKKSQNTFSGTI